MQDEMLDRLNRATFEVLLKRAFDAHNARAVAEEIKATGPQFVNGDTVTFRGSFDAINAYINAGCPEPLLDPAFEPDLCSIDEFERRYIQPAVSAAVADAPIYYPNGCPILSENDLA